jgi:hypothetical protein
MPPVKKARDKGIFFMFYCVIYIPLRQASTLLAITINTSFMIGPYYTHFNIVYQELTLPAMSQVLIVDKSPILKGRDLAVG